MRAEAAERQLRLQTYLREYLWYSGKPVFRNLNTTEYEYEIPAGMEKVLDRMGEHGRWVWRNLIEGDDIAVDCEW